MPDGLGLGPPCDTCGRGERPSPVGRAWPCNKPGAHPGRPGWRANPDCAQGCQGRAAGEALGPSLAAPPRCGMDSTLRGARAAGLGRGGKGRSVRDRPGPGVKDHDAGGCLGPIGRCDPFGMSTGLDPDPARSRANRPAEGGARRARVAGRLRNGSRPAGWQGHATARPLGGCSPRGRAAGDMPRKNSSCPIFSYRISNILEPESATPLG